MNKMYIFKSGLISLGCLFFSSPILAQSGFQNNGQNNSLSNQVSGQSGNTTNSQMSQNLGQNNNSNTQMVQNQNGQAVPLSQIPEDQVIYIRSQEGQLIPYRKAGGLMQQATDPAANPSSMNLPPPPDLPTKNTQASDKELQRRAMDELYDRRFSVTPDDIIRQRQEEQKRKRAAAQNPETPPKPVTRTINISLQPGSAPEIIRTYTNESTALIVTDSTGQPWPVVNYSVGNSEAYDVQRLDSLESGGGSMFSISPKTDYAKSNMILALKGKSTPVTISLIAGQNVVDYRVNARVLSTGPNAQISYTNMPNSASTDLLTVLDGVPPENSKQLEVTGQMSNNTTVWLQNNDTMIVRTDLNIKSPKTTNSVSSSDGTHVYKFAPTSPLLAKKNGRYTNLRVSGW